MSSVNPAGPTLKQLSLVAIAVKISNDPEIKAYDGFPFKIIRYRANDVPESANDPTSTMWEEIVSKKISCLGLLPETLKSELRYFIHLICLEIYKWQKDHKACAFSSEVLQRCFCWNSQAKIDRIKTAKALIDNQCQCKSVLHTLALIYGFKSYTTSIWQEMNDSEIKAYFFSYHNRVRDLIRDQET
ncbi:hypothetical protein TNCV_4468321 [Trichonephila clavipes]|nr:hypothetical protein TNCV_4468321 [Trichonephila clavipes]